MTYPLPATIIMVVIVPPIIATVVMVTAVATFKIAFITISRVVVMNDSWRTHPYPLSWAGGSICPELVATPFVENAKTVLTAPIVVRNAELGLYPYDPGVNIIAIISSVSQ